MKVLGGKYKGRNIYMPKDIRPSQNIIREAVFDILGHDFTDINMLEIFAGSGAIGIEALSRGANSVTFVDSSPISIKTIQENLNLLDITLYEDGHQNYKILKSDAFAGIKLLFQEKASFDVIFIDPEYDRGHAKKALKTLDAYDIVQPNCHVVIEHGKREILPEKEGRFSLFKQKKYGSTYLSIFTC